MHFFAINVKGRWLGLHDVAGGTSGVLSQRRSRCGTSSAIALVRPCFSSSALLVTSNVRSFARSLNNLLHSFRIVFYAGRHRLVWAGAD